MHSPTQATLIKKLDKIFSEYVRRRDAKDGVARCVTCGKYDDWKRVHAGHFIVRQHKTTRWDERNVWPQCVSCNSFHEGAKDEYSLFLVRKYGPQILEELNRHKHSIFKLDKLWLETLIKEYQGKLMELNK